MNQPEPTPVFSVSPIVLPAPDRAVDLQVRVSAPVAGTALPIILLSHGLGFSNHLSSLNGYAPLVNSWAAQGFAVIQPTHLDSKTLSQNPAVNPGGDHDPRHWRTRAQDMSRILDQLDVIEAAVPHLAGRFGEPRTSRTHDPIGSDPKRRSGRAGEAQEVHSRVP